MTNLIRDIEETVGAMPEETAVWFQGTEISYQAFWHRTGQLARALADAGIDPDDRVGVYLPNLPQFVTAYYATVRAGGVVVPMNPQYKAREIEHMLTDSEATLVITLPDLVPEVAQIRDATEVEQVVTVGQAVEGSVAYEDFLAEDPLPVVEREDDDIAAQPYTSGTTGTPKGVLLTHRNLAWTTRTGSTLLEDAIDPEDKLLGVLPLFHIFGMTVVMNASLYNGATYYPLPEWNAEEAMGLVADQSLTIMHGVPAMFNDVINHPEAESFDLSSLRFVNSGGSSCPIEVIERFEELYGTELYEGYGLTETSPITHANRPDARRKGSIGQPLPGLDSRVVDDDFKELPRVEEGPIDEEEIDVERIVGEIVVSGPNVMKGYHERPEANEEAFTESDGTTWFHTGDLGYWDEDDFFYVIDREKHMIVTGGYNVYPREVEELLFEHPDVADASVVGIPDERRGEVPKAFIVPTPNAETTPAEIKEYCLDNLAEYKHPREIEFLKELPRTTTGKVQKFKLREREAD